MTDCLMNLTATENTEADGGARKKQITCLCEYLFKIGTKKKSKVT